MGCVLGTTASSSAARDKPEPADRQQRSADHTFQSVEKTAASSSKEASAASSAHLNERLGGAGSSYNNPHIGLKDKQGWPLWLSEVAGDVIKDWTPRRANTFEKLDKIGQGTYSNVYKAKDLMSGKIVALKKVRFDAEPESVKFMAREILLMRRLDHPNVLKLEGLVTSRMSTSLYLVFQYMEHDLTGLAARQSGKFTLPQIKCYMKQLLSGLEHCHNNGVLHRDIKSSNLLIDDDGILKIADFGLSSFFDPRNRHPMSSKVVTLWYRPPELLLGATYYGVGVDLWSAGCILAELLAGRPILPGKTEVEQLHKIFKLCGSPSEEYWKKHKLPNATLFKPQQPYKRSTEEVFKDFPPSSLTLIDTLLSLEPDRRGSATASLNSEFFTTEPCACEPSSLPKYPPSKELDIKLKDEKEKRQQKELNRKAHTTDGGKKIRPRERVNRAIPAPEANAELQLNLEKRRVVTQGNTRIKSEKFPPPHQDGVLGFPPDNSHNGSLSFGQPDASFSSSVFETKSPPSSEQTVQRKKTNQKGPDMAFSKRIMRAFMPSTVRPSVDLISKGKQSVS